MSRPPLAAPPGADAAARYLQRHSLLFGDRLFLDKPVTAGPQPRPTSPGGDGASLAEFEEAICQCQNCPLGATRTKFVFGVGNPAADLVLVGEAPGVEEDRRGEPFVGRAGQLLDQILGAIGLTRDEVYICNILKCRPPNNRDPLTAEVAECLPYLKRQLQIIQPKLIVALGRVAARHLLGLEDTLKNMRKQIYSYEGVELRVTYHTAALLRNPSLKAAAWEDFQAIRDRYRELANAPVGLG